MRVLLLNDLKGCSGAEVIYNTIAEELERRGMKALCVAGDDVHKLPTIIGKFEPDVLHQHNATRIGGTTLTFMKRNPSVQTFHDYWPICRMRDHYFNETLSQCKEVDRNQERCRGCPNYLGMLRSPSFLMEMWGEDPTIIFTAVSEYVSEKVRSYGYKEVHTVHNGIREEEDTGEATDEGFIFVPAKADHRSMKKGIPVANEIARRIPQYRFVHAGGGKWNHMEEVGLLSREQMMDYYRRCSMAIIPSLWEEPNGLPCQEAMQYGKPILGFSFAGGIPEYIGNGSCDSMEDMIEHILSIMGDEGLRKKWGVYARERFTDFFTLEKMVDRYLFVYERAIEKFNERRGK